MAEYSHVCIICQNLFLTKKSSSKTCSRHCHYVLVNQTKRSRPFNEQKFWANTNRDTLSGCWEWKGRLGHNGYGQISFKGKVIRVHRLSYLLTYNELPPNLNICHSCDNRKCVNPSHLWAGTQKENMEDCVAKGRINRKYFSDLGLPLVSKPKSKLPKAPPNKQWFNYSKKLDEQKVIEIRELYATGQYNYSQIGKFFNVHSTAIAQIIRRQTWTWV